MSEVKSDCEHCQSCGRPYKLVWVASDDIWKKIVQRGEAGLRCPDCFDMECRERGVFLNWSCNPNDVTLWIEQSDQQASESVNQRAQKGLTFDAEQARKAVEALTPLCCGICRYPVMAVWKYCPGCGVQLIWEGIQNIKK